MRITCPDIESFLECLKAESKFHQDTIRLSIINKPLGNNPREAIQFEVVLQTSTVVTCDDDSQYLLESSQFCGIDSEDGEGEYIGTEEATRLKDLIQQFANGRNLKVLPGIIQI